MAGSPLPLTTGNESLDITIVRHLQYCTQLVQVGSATVFVLDPRLFMHQECVLPFFSFAREMNVQEYENKPASLWADSKVLMALAILPEPWVFYLET